MRRKTAQRLMIALKKELIVFHLRFAGNYDGIFSKKNESL